ncbi:MAG: hypothetical protein ACLUTA_08765 [Blautia wexlerae]
MIFVFRCVEAVIRCRNLSHSQDSCTGDAMRTPQQRILESKALRLRGRKTQYEAGTMREPASTQRFIRENIWGCYRTKIYSETHDPPISIVIPNKDHIEDLEEMYGIH